MRNARRSWPAGRFSRCRTDAARAEERDQNALQLTYRSSVPLQRRHGSCGWPHCSHHDNEAFLHMKGEAMSGRPSEMAVRARTSLGIFLSLVVLGSTPLLWSIIASGLPVESPEMLPRMIALMWVPAIASVVTRLVRREGFRDVSFRILRSPISAESGWRSSRASVQMTATPG
jgi:hypothetical protein